MVVFFFEATTSDTTTCQSERPSSIHRTHIFKPEEQNDESVNANHVTGIGNDQSERCIPFAGAAER